MPPISRLTITRGQVAELLGLSEATFKKRQGDLEGFGFPRKLPGLNAWSRPAIVDWIGSNGGTYQPQAPIEPVRQGAVEAARSDLEQRYAGAA